MRELNLEQIEKEAERDATDSLVPESHRNYWTHGFRKGAEFIFNFLHNTESEKSFEDKMLERMANSPQTKDMLQNPDKYTIDLSTVLLEKITQSTIDDLKKASLFTELKLDEPSDWEEERKGFCAELIGQEHRLGTQIDILNQKLLGQSEELEDYRKVIADEIGRRGQNHVPQLFSVFNKYKKNK